MERTRLGTLGSIVRVILIYAVIVGGGQSLLSGPYRHSLILPIYIFFLCFLAAVVCYMFEKRFFPSIITTKPLARIVGRLIFETAVLVTCVLVPVRLIDYWRSIQQLEGWLYFMAIGGAILVVNGLLYLFWRYTRLFHSDVDIRM